METEKLKQRLAISDKKNAAITELYTKLCSDHEELVGQLKGWKLVPISDPSEAQGASKNRNHTSVDADIAQAAFTVKSNSWPKEATGEQGSSQNIHKSNLPLPLSVLSPQTPRFSKPGSHDFNPPLSPATQFHGASGQVDNAGLSSATTPRYVHPRARSKVASNSPVAQSFASSSTNGKFIWTSAVLVVTFTASANHALLTVR